MVKLNKTKLVNFHTLNPYLAQGSFLTLPSPLLTAVLLYPILTRLAICYSSRTSCTFGTFLVSLVALCYRAACPFKGWGGVGVGSEQPALFWRGAWQTRCWESSDTARQHQVFEVADSQLGGINEGVWDQERAGSTCFCVRSRRR